MVELHFRLDIEDGWPPVSLEGVPCTLMKNGEYRIESPPLYVKHLSVGDVISVTLNDKEEVVSWRHIAKSNRSTIWLLRLVNSDEIEVVLQELISMNCRTVRLPQYGSYSIDVPEECAIDKVDACLGKLDQSHVAIAYPSFRHWEIDGVRLN